MHYKFFAVVKVIIIFRADADEMNGTQVETVEHLWAHFSIKMYRKARPLYNLGIKFVLY